MANAGIAQVKPLLELTEEDFERMFRVNVRVFSPPSPSHPSILIMISGQVFGVQNSFSAAAKQIISQRTAQRDHPAKLISAASIVAFKPFALLSHYSASKWAVRGLTQAYAMEMAEHHITVNAYAPGIVGTAMWDLIDEELGKKQGARKGETIRKYSEELVSV